jgi:hypothetical protein
MAAVEATPVPALVEAFGVRAGLGRIVVSAIEAPNTFTNLVWGG